MSYSINFRRKVLSVREKEGLSIRETAKRFHIGSASVSRWLNQIDPKPSTTRQRKINKSALGRVLNSFSLLIKHDIITSNSIEDWRMIRRVLTDSMWEQLQKIMKKQGCHC